jgi:hypothetical protein
MILYLRKEMKNMKGVLELHKIWYESLPKKKKEKINNKIQKEWKLSWEDCSETLKEVIYYKERGK